MGETVSVIGNWFSITYIQNRGAAFGIFAEQQWLFISMAIIMLLAAIIFTMHYRHNHWLVLTTGLITGGAIGNLYDRCSYRAVIDFLSFGSFPVFNVADMAITIGGVLLVYRIWRYGT